MMMSGVLVEDAIAIALSLDRIPNTSYFPRTIARALRQYLKDFPEIQVAEDTFAIYAHYSHGTPHYKLIIDTHLDHPGFILLGKGAAIPVATIAEPTRSQRINERQQAIPVSFYDHQGKQTSDEY